MLRTPFFEFPKNSILFEQTFQINIKIKLDLSDEGTDHFPLFKLGYLRKHSSNTVYEFFFVSKITLNEV